MAEATVLDRFGHPGALAEATHRFDESMRLARDLAPEELERSIAQELLEIVHRDEQLRNGIRLALDSLPGSTDDDASRALLTMTVPYGIETSNQIGRLAGRVLVALQYSKRAGAAHG